MARFVHRRTALMSAIAGLLALLGAILVPMISRAGVSGSVGDGPMVVQSGQTPISFQPGANVTRFDTATVPAEWMRVGDTVEMSGAMGVYATAGDGRYTSAYISLPVDSAFGSGSVSGNNDCWGVATVGTVPGRIAGSTDSGHTHQCEVYWEPNTTSLVYIHYSLTYRVLG